MTKENPETQLNNFIKTQEIPHTTNSGYLAYGSKMNPKTQASALKILIAIPIAVLFVGLSFVSENFGQVLIFILIFLVSVYIIYKLMKKVNKNK